MMFARSCPPAYRDYTEFASTVEAASELSSQRRTGQETLKLEPFPNEESFFPSEFFRHLKQYFFYLYLKNGFVSVDIFFIFSAHLYIR